MRFDLTAGIVRILKPDRTTAGTGFVVTDGLVATCAHVVKSAGAWPGTTVRLIFHATKDELEARVEPEYWRDPSFQDVAILHLLGPLPDPVHAILLGGSSGIDGHPLTTFGFPEVKSVEGLPGRGEVVGNTTERDFRVLALRSQEITSGFSGAPVLDTLTCRVIGMVTSIAPPDQYNRLTETAFITPTETLKEICPALQMSEVPPYRGLNAFTEDDAQFFFGRQRVVDKLLNKLRSEHRFLAVLGPSGSGKSSVIQAGLIPQLRLGKIPSSDRWGVIITRRYDHPFEQLAAAGLAGAREGFVEVVRKWLEQHHDRRRLMLVLDQFEELLVSCPEPLRQDLLEQLAALLDSPLGITVVLVMRDDFYSRFAQQAPELCQEWLPRGLVQVPLDLNRDELIAIVEEPARVVGLTFADGLVAKIIDHAKAAATGEGGERFAQSTILPLLEFTLTELSEPDRCQDGMLTHEAYDGFGGVTGGLTSWADQAYLTLDEPLRALARRILTDLVHLGESREIPDSPRRRLAAALSRSEGEHEAVQRVVQHLANTRLLVTTRDLHSGEASVEIIHYALLREWGRLQHWVKEDKRFLFWHQEIEIRAQEWLKGRDEGVLLRGGLLTEAQGWMTERKSDLGQAEQAFIQASQERQVHEEQRWKELYDDAERQRKEAERQRDEAERQRVLALGRQLTAQAELFRQASLPLSVLLAVESLRRAPSREADQVLRSGLMLLRKRVLQVIYAKTVGDITFSHDGRYIASSSWDHTASVYDIATGHEALRVRHGGVVAAVAFSPDGQYVATASFDGTARVTAIANREEVARLPHKAAVNDVVFSRNGKYVATASDFPEGMARLWEIVTGTEVAKVTYGNVAQTVLFSPDGKYLVSTNWIKPIVVLEVDTGRPITHLWQEQGIYGLAFSPNGRYLATGGGGDIKVWETATWNVVKTLTPPEVLKKEQKYHLTFSPNNKYISAAHGPFAIVWETPTWIETTRMLHRGSVTALDFSQDGRFLATANTDNTGRVWKVATGQDTGQEVARMTHEGQVTDIAFSRDGCYLATGSLDGTACVWETTGHREVAPEDLISEACSRLTRNLTPEEWYQYLGTEPYCKTCLNLD